jgi:nucleotide-binding universal stress UspA family protein
MNERTIARDAPPITTILVPLDGSPDAASALPYALALTTPGTTLLLLTVVGNEEEAGAARVVLEQSAERARVAGLDVRTETAVGDPAEQILAVAALAGAGLIVMASHGRGAVGRLIYGSVADRVARESPVPTMVVRAAIAAPGPVGITRLVVPLDGSPLAEQSLPFATAISRRLGTPLFLVRAVSSAELMPPAVGMGEAIPFELYAEAEREQEREAKIHLDGVAQRLREQGLPVASEVITGAAATAIEEATRPGDVVVLCSHERTGVMRWLLGSVAETLTREDQSPVILVPASESK